MKKQWIYLLAVPFVALMSCKKTEVTDPEPTTPGSGGGGGGTTYVAPSTSELMISEISVVTRTDIPETGNQRNTYIELYNGTGSDIDLSEYVMFYSKNSDTWGASEGDTLKMTGSLAHGSCYLIIRPSIDPATSTLPVDMADITWNNLKANGDDGIALAKSDGQGGFGIIDAWGEETVPASGDWDMCGVTAGASDMVLQRKYATAGPTDNWATSSGASTADCQWEMLTLGEYQNVKLPTGHP